jgi:hypothetical protein
LQKRRRERKKERMSDNSDSSPEQADTKWNPG